MTTSFTIVDRAVPDFLEAPQGCGVEVVLTANYLGNSSAIGKTAKA